DDLWNTRANGQTDTAGLSRQTAVKLLPLCATIGALENSADIFTTGQVRAGSKTPRGALSRVKRSIDDFRVRRIDHHIAAARTRVVRSRCVQGQFPVLARIGRFKQPA